MSQRNNIRLLQNDKIDPRIHIFRRTFTNAADDSELQVDAYVIRTQRFLICCDTLLSPSDTAFMVEHTQNEIKGEGWEDDQIPPATRQWLIINSHSDWDHTWGNCYFTRQTGQIAPPIIGYGENAIRQTTSEAQALLCEYRQNNKLFREVKIEPPNTSFEGYMAINGGDLTLSLFHAPGHSDDHLAIWIPQIHALLAFDAVEWPFPTIANAASISACSATIQHFLQLDPRYIFCSHGTEDGVEGERILQHNYRYLQQIEKKASAFIKQHTITSGEIERADCADLIDFAYDEASEGEASEGIVTYDEAYYRRTHQNNVRYMLRHLLESVD